MRFNRQARAGYKYWPPCGVPVNMQHKFQQYLCFSSSTEGWTLQLHADLGTHSAHCAADRGLAGTVFGWLWTRLLLCNDRCPGWGAQKTVEFRSCRFSGLRNARFGDGYLIGIIQGGFWKNSTIFHVTGWTRILGSILVVHCTHGR